MDIHIPDENIVRAKDTSAAPMHGPADAQLPKKHQHGWHCFRTSGGYTGAMELDTPLSERIEAVYKTAYRTGYKNGVADAKGK